MPTIPSRPAAQRRWRAEVRRLRTAGLFAADVRAGGLPGTRSTPTTDLGCHWSWEQPATVGWGDAMPARIAAAPEILRMREKTIGLSGVRCCPAA